MAVSLAVKYVVRLIAMAAVTVVVTVEAAAVVKAFAVVVVARVTTSSQPRGEAASVGEDHGGSNVLFLVYCSGNSQQWL